MDEPVRRDHHTVSGQLRFTGTRVPVDTLTDWLREGYGIDEYLQNYPTVGREQVQQTLSLMLTALQEGRPLDHRVVWCVIHETRYGECRRVHQIHTTRDSAEAACVKLQTGHDQWPARWEVEDWLVHGEETEVGDETDQRKKDGGGKHG